MLRVSFSLLSLVCRASFFSFYFYFFWGSKFVFQSFKFLALFSCCASIILDFELSPDMYNVKLHSSFFVLWLILDRSWPLETNPAASKQAKDVLLTAPHVPLPEDTPYQQIRNSIHGILKIPISEVGKKQKT